MYILWQCTSLVINKHIPYCLHVNLDLPLRLATFSPLPQIQSWQLLSVQSCITFYSSLLQFSHTIIHTSLFLFFLCGQGIRSKNFLILGPRDGLAETCFLSASTSPTTSPPGSVSPLVGSKSDNSSTTLSCLFSWAI